MLKKTSAFAFTIISILIRACESAVPAAQPPASAEPARVESQAPPSDSNVVQDIPAQETSINRTAPELEKPEEPDNLADSTLKDGSVTDTPHDKVAEESPLKLETPSDSTAPTSSTKAKDSSKSAQVDQPSAPAPAVVSEPLPTSTSLPQSVEPAPTAATPDPTPELISVPTAEPEPLPLVAYGNDIDKAAHPFMLPSALGQEYSLESFRGDKNVVLVFYRAFW